MPSTPADLLHGKEEYVYADSGYRGAQSRVERDDLQWHIAARPSDIAKMPAGRAKSRVQREEHRKASMRAKVEHPFPVIKRQFGLGDSNHDLLEQSQLLRAQVPARFRVVQTFL